jgi:hypothetical protein
MADLQQEREHLILADRHLAAGERRIAEQITLIEKMIQQGQDAAEAKKLLRNFEVTLKIWHAHRQLILDTIAQG